MEFTESSRTLIKKCVTCHDQCMAYTPEIKFLYKQSYAVSRKALIADLLAQGKIQADADFAEIIFSAMNTGLPRCNCIFSPDSVDEAEYIREVRAYLADREILPAPVKKLRELARQGSIYGEMRGNFKPVHTAGETALVFDGASRLFAPGAVKAACAVVDLIEKNGAVIHVPSCGFIERELGFTAEADRAVQNFLSALDEQTRTTVVSTDPAVVIMLRGAGVKARHFSEYLAEKLNPALLKPVRIKAAYHDSSNLARYLNVLDKPRECIGLVPGVEYGEFVYNREQARPSGGRYGYLHYERSLKLADERLEEARQIGVDIVITASPFSYYNLSKRASGIQVMDLAELAALALGRVPD